jgi:hypothetical protein
MLKSPDFYNVDADYSSIEFKHYAVKLTMPYPMKNNSNKSSPHSVKERSSAVTYAIVRI